MNAKYDRKLLDKLAKNNETIIVSYKDYYGLVRVEKTNFNTNYELAYGTITLLIDNKEYCTDINNIEINNFEEGS